jgi:hypothetical protein
MARAQDEATAMSVEQAKAAANARASHAESGAPIAQSPRAFYERVVQRADIRQILRRLAK